MKVSTLTGKTSIDAAGNLYVFKDEQVRNIHVESWIIEQFDLDLPHDLPLELRAGPKVIEITVRQID